MGLAWQLVDWHCCVVSAQFYIREQVARQGSFGLRVAFRGREDTHPSWGRPESVKSKFTTAANFVLLMTEMRPAIVFSECRFIDSFFSVFMSEDVPQLISWQHSFGNFNDTEIIAKYTFQKLNTRAGELIHQNLKEHFARLTFFLRSYVHVHYMHTHAIAKILNSQRDGTIFHGLNEYIIRKICNKYKCDHKISDLVST